MQSHQIANNDDYREIARALECNPAAFDHDALTAIADKLHASADQAEDHERETSELEDELNGERSLANAVIDERDELRDELAELTRERDDLERQLDRALAK